MTKDSETKEIATSATHHELQYQRNLFPIEIVDIYPCQQDSADLKSIGTGKNNKEYAIKRVSDSPNGFIPASELFCYELARQVNIATPDFDILQLQGDELAFGSVWEGGVHKLSNDNKIIDLLEGNLKVNNIEQFFSKVYGFDLFINNIDRHFGNYLFRSSFSYFIAMAFDFSRAWLEIDSSGLQVTQPSCNTQFIFRTLKQFKKISLAPIQSTLDDLSKIDQNTVKGIIDEIPATWLTEEQASEVIFWWGTKEFTDRVNFLKEGVTHAMV